jgi:hypothetical protein
VAAFMEVLGLTIFISFALGVLFAVMFFFSQRDTRRGIEQDALLPLDDAPPAQANAPRTLSHNSLTP